MYPENLILRKGKTKQGICMCVRARGPVRGRITANDSDFTGKSGKCINGSTLSVLQIKTLHSLKNALGYTYVYLYFPRHCSFVARTLVFYEIIICLCFFLWYSAEDNLKPFWCSHSFSDNNNYEDLQRNSIANG